MLPVALHDVTFRHRSGFALERLRVDFAAGAHTAITGTAGAGVSTLLQLIAGDLSPASGSITIGDRVVNGVRRSKRPLLHVTGALEIPGRWAVDHALVAALRDRSLDRIDRQREFQLAVEKWRLEDLLRRRVDTLSSSERLMVHVARIELMRPAILVADRFLASLNPSRRIEIADAIFRSLRVSGATVITAPSDPAELAFSDEVVVLDRGRVVQTGTSADVYGRPADERAAEAGGAINVIPVVIHAGTVESPIGSWQVAEPPFEGTGLALIRPEDFELARPGEESDFVFSIEEAGFAAGRWRATGFLTGSILIHVDLPRETIIRKGRLLPIRFDPSRVRLIAREMKASDGRIPTDAIPSMRDTR